MKYLAILFFALISSCKEQNSNKNIISIKGNKLILEVADTDHKRELGLMNRKSLDQNKGMLFVFEHESILSFWMKNTLIPLSIGYIDKSCNIIDIQQMYPADKNDSNPKTYPSKKPALYALETNINWFKEHKINVGDKITVHSKTLKFCN